jgi:formylglycine-generating enzyme required for sulfatase activity
MQIGNWTWAAGWLTVSTALAILASMLGPGPGPNVDEPVAMIRIPAGPFTMGAEDQADDQRPVQSVTLAAFEVDRLPVTNAQFAAFLNRREPTATATALLVNVDDPPDKIWRVGNRYTPEVGFERHPVIAETWPGARAYCAWRGARLPTEAERERAARGTTGRTYPWGEEPPGVLRARFGFRLNDYLPVGSYPDGATPEGVLDLAGNVWQWTSTLYRPYPYRSDDGREDPTATGARVIRGGSHNASAELLRASSRSIGLVQGRPSTGVVGMVGSRPTIGFRCARDA